MFAKISRHISIDKIVLVLHDSDRPGLVWSKYSEGRGVCGIVAAEGGTSEYAFSDGSKRLLSAGEVALFSDKSAYVIKNISNEFFPHYTINFTLAPGYSLTQQEMYLKPADFQNITNKCKQMLGFWRSGEPLSEMRCTAVLYDLLADIFEEGFINEIGRQTYSTVLPAISYIDAHFNEKISLNDLAKLCMMSMTSFRRTFTEVCRMSPIEYLINVRIKRASELLSRSVLSVSEVAEKCGFKDTEHFCRTFKKRMGITAGQARIGELTKEDEALLSNNSGSKSYVISAKDKI